MNATKEAKVIGLWLDSTSSAENGPTWIVSLDTMNERGEAVTTTTIDTYAEDDYAAARAAAIDAARRSDICVIETGSDNSQTCIYQPEGAVNPIE